jgi:hypothetical protein
MNDHTDASANEIPHAERIDTIQIGTEPGTERFEETGCTPEMHEGRPVITFVMGPADQAVRKIKLCSACEMVFEERAFPDCSGITLEGVGGTCDRVTNYPGEETLVKRPLDEILAAGEQDGETAPVTHAGVIEHTNELMLKFAEDDNAE